MSGVVILRTRRNIGSFVLGTSSLFFELRVPNSAIACTLFPQVSCTIASVFLRPTVSLSHGHVCKLAQSVVCGHENQTSQQAFGGPLSLSRGLHQFGERSCNPGGDESERARTKSSIGDRLHRVLILPQLDPISTVPATHVHVESISCADLEYGCLHSRCKEALYLLLHWTSIHRLPRHLFVS